MHHIHVDTMERRIMHEQEHPVLDWFLDRLALLLLTLSAIAVLGVAIGSGMVMFGAFSWDIATEVAAYFGLGVGAVVGLCWFCKCAKDACYKKFR